MQGGSKYINKSILYTILQNEGVKKKHNNLNWKTIWQNTIPFCDKSSQLGIEGNFHNVIKATRKTHM